MKIVYDKLFLKQASKLPKQTSEKLADLLLIFEENPFSAFLHTKQLSGKLNGFFSFRITRNWRVTFQFNDSHTIQLLDVKHRKDIYR